MVPLGNPEQSHCRLAPFGVLPLVPLVILPTVPLAYQWYHWLTNGTNCTIGRANGTIGITIDTNGIANGTIGKNLERYWYTIGTIGKPRTHAIVCNIGYHRSLQMVSHQASFFTNKSEYILRGP